MDGKVFILEDDNKHMRTYQLVALEMNGLEFKAYSTVNEFFAGIKRRTARRSPCLTLCFHDGNRVGRFLYVKKVSFGSLH